MNGAPATIDDGRKLALPFVDLLPATGVAICVLDRAGQALMIYATDETASGLEETQFDLGDGPLFECFDTGQPTLVPDIVTSDRWPLFLAKAQDLNVAAVFLFPLTLGAACIGAALCYRCTAGPLDNESLGVGCALGRAVAGQALRRAMMLAEDGESDEAAAIEVRRAVHQATGMVLIQLDSDASDALAQMRAYAFAHGISLQEVARDVVSRRLHFSTSRE